MDIISFDIEVMTVIVQLISTLVLLIVVRMFAIRPLKKFLAARQQLIADDFAMAETAKMDAEAFKVDAQAGVDVAKADAKKILEVAKGEADEKHEAMLEQARKDVDAKLAQAKSEIERERNAMQEQAKQELANIATDATAKLIQKEIDAATHDALFDEFVNQVGGLDA